MYCWLLGQFVCEIFQLILKLNINYTLHTKSGNFQLYMQPSPLNHTITPPLTKAAHLVFLAQQFHLSRVFRFTQTPSHQTTVSDYFVWRNITNAATCYIVKCPPWLLYFKHRNTKNDASFAVLAIIINSYVKRMGSIKSASTVPAYNDDIKSHQSRIKLCIYNEPSILHRLLCNYIAPTHIHLHSAHHTAYMPTKNNALLYWPILKCCVAFVFVCFTHLKPDATVAPPH